MGVSTVNEQQTSNKDPEIVFINDSSDENLRNTIASAYKAHSNNKPLAQIVQKIKEDLDSKLSKGWIVFAGRDMVGACSYIENTLVEFEVNKTAFVIFQTYCPE